MKGILNAFSTLINFFKMIFNIFMDFFETTAMVFRYLLTIVDLVFDTILTFPSWIKAFAVITVSISIAYILISRNAGRSE